VCWNIFRAFETSPAVFLNEKQQKTVTFHKIRQSAGNQKYKGCKALNTFIK